MLLKMIMLKDFTDLFMSKLKMSWVMARYLHFRLGRFFFKKLLMFWTAAGIECSSHEAIFCRNSLSIFEVCNVFHTIMAITTLHDTLRLPFVNLIMLLLLLIQKKTRFSGFSIHDKSWWCSKTFSLSSLEGFHHCTSSRRSLTAPVDNSSTLNQNAVSASSEREFFRHA